MKKPRIKRTRAEGTAAEREDRRLYLKWLRNPKHKYAAIQERQ